MKFTIIKSCLARFSGTFAVGTPYNIHGTAISYRCAKFGAFVNSVTILTLRDLTMGQSGSGAKKERGLKGFRPKKESRLSACKQVLPREHNIIASLKINQSAFRIPFWDADIQFYEMRVQTPLSLFPLPPLYPRKPQESLLAG